MAYSSTASSSHQVTHDSKLEGLGTTSSTNRVSETQSIATFGNDIYEFDNYLRGISEQAYDMSLHELERQVVKLESDRKICLEYNNPSRLQVCMHKLMNACAKAKSLRGAELCERVLVVVTLNADEGGEGPTREMYTIAMDAWAKLEQHEEKDDLYLASRARGILDYMWQNYNECKGDNTKGGVERPKPDIIHYTTLLLALAKSSSREKATRIALRLLKEAERLSGIEPIINKIMVDSSSDLSSTDGMNIDANLLPDRVCYNSILHMLSQYPSAHNHRGNFISSDEVMQQMNKILSRMEKLSVLLNDKTLMPNVKSYNALIKACSLLPEDIGERAENILRELSERSNKNDECENNSDGFIQDDVIGDNSIAPNIKSFNFAINAWAHDKSIEAPQRAEDLLISLVLNSLSPLSQNGEVSITKGVVPDVVTFNTCLNAWSKSDLRDSGWRAEELLEYLLIISGSRRLNKEHQRKERIGFLKVISTKEDNEALDIYPNVISFNTVINALSRCGDEGMERTEVWLDYLLDGMLISNGSNDVRPNVITFSTIIHGWAKSGNKKSGQNAENVLEKMLSLYQETQSEDYKPTISCYTGLVSAWCQSKDFDKAYDAVRRLEEGGYKPKTSLYNELFNTLNTDIQQSDEDRAIKGASLLNKMMKESKLDKDAATPNTYSFNHVLKCFHNHGKTKREALFSALDIFNRLCKCQDCQPNEQSFIHISKIIQSSMIDESKERTMLCEDMFRMCCEHGLLTNAVIRIIENMLPPFSLQKIEACRIDSSMKGLNIYNLPSEWSCNRRKGQNQRRKGYKWK
jgi:pentatricopeptide repeat protein